MKQKFTILFDLDGTLVDTAPDLMLAHNHVMRKFGYPTKSTEDIRNLVGKGAGALIGRSIWGQAKKEFSKVLDEKIKNEMVKEFVNFYGKNFVKTMLHQGKEKKNLGVIFDQVGTPTYARDLAKTCLDVLCGESPLNISKNGNLYHYSNEGVTSWYDFAISILSLIHI